MCICAFKPSCGAAVALFHSSQFVREELIKICLQVAHADFYRSERSRRPHPEGKRGDSLRSQDDTDSRSGTATRGVIGYTERLERVKENRKKQVNQSRNQGERGHNHCNQLNKAFLCLGAKKCTWKHLLILQEGKCQSAAGLGLGSAALLGFVMISLNSQPLNLTNLQNQSARQYVSTHTAHHIKTTKPLGSHMRVHNPRKQVFA